MSQLNITIPLLEKDLSSMKVRTRCGSCKKKLGLVSFACKCGGSYCAEHRADTIHNCSYDYQSEQKQCLSTMMIKIEAKKTEII
jgi:hypothetical protein